MIDAIRMFMLNAFFLQQGLTSLRSMSSNNDVAADGRQQTTIRRSRLRLEKRLPRAAAASSADLASIAPRVHTSSTSCGSRAGSVVADQ
eukprot:1076258-Pleurochrysis_carterae.AAC.2